MPAKIYDIPGIGLVNIYKRKGSRSLRLSFTDKGEVRVNVPSWVSYQAGITFALERREWIEKHRPLAHQHIQNGDKIGKAHHIQFIPGANTKSIQVRVKDNTIFVKYPAGTSFDDPKLQSAVERGSKKALQAEAEHLLPQRIRSLALQHGFQYRSVAVKQLKSKWGSCNQHQEITLNYYLMQLPWRLIDYVLIHELTHTQHLNHGEAFWRRFEEALPGAKKIRKELKPFKTAVVAG